MTREEQLLESTVTLVGANNRLVQINEDQQKMLRRQLTKSDSLLNFCLSVYDIISHKEERTAQEEQWLEKVRDKLTLEH